MTKARTLANFISDGSTLADGAISVSEVSGAAPLASPTFSGHLDLNTNTNVFFTNTAQSALGFNRSSSGNFTTGTAPFRAGQYIFNVGSGYHAFQTSSNQGAAGSTISGWNSNLHLYHNASVFNQDGLNMDFRVESDNTSHMFYVDAGDDRVSIGGSTQSGVFTVNGGTTTKQSMWVYGQASGQGGRILSIRDTRAASGTNGSAGIHLTSSPGTDYVLAKYWDGTYSNFMLTDQTGNEYLSIESAANIVINQGGSSGKDFRVESTGNTHMLFVDSGANKVGIGGSSFNYGSALTLHANDSGGAPTSLFLRNSGTAGGSGATIHSGYTSGYGAQIRFNGNPSSYRMASTTFATVTGDSSTQDNLQISTTGDTIVYNDLGVGHGGNPDHVLDVEASVSGDWISQIYNTHSSNGYGLKVRAGDNGDVNSFRVVAQNNDILLNVYGDGNVSKPKHTTFLAYNTAPQNNIAFGSNVTVVLNAERFDQNSDFSSNAFIAPIDGKYLFSYSLYLRNVQIAAGYYELRLVTSNRVYDTIISPNGFDLNLNYFHLNGSVIADMETGDQCFLRIVQGTGTGATAATDIETGSWLSGTLIA